MTDNFLPNPVGKPQISVDAKENIVRKLEPYLKSGLSIRKACDEAKIPKSTVYDFIKEDKEFADKISTLQNYLSILISNIVYVHLVAIKNKQQNNEKISKEDLDFVKWFAVNSKLTKDEFGERKQFEILDPEKELERIRKMIYENNNIKPTSS